MDICSNGLVIFVYLLIDLIVSRSQLIMTYICYATAMLIKIKKRTQYVSVCDFSNLKSFNDFACKNVGLFEKINIFTENISLFANICSKFIIKLLFQSTVA